MFYRPLSIFFIACVVGFTTPHIHLVLYLIFTALTLPFPLLLAWAFLQNRTHRAGLLFWLATLSTANFSATTGLYHLIFGIDGVLYGSFFTALGGMYILTLSKRVPACHSNLEPINPFLWLKEKVKQPHTRSHRN